MSTVTAPDALAQSDNVQRGILIMLLAVGAFSLMDAGLKTLAPHYPPLQVTALRALSSLPLVLVWCAVHGGFGQLLRVRWPLHVLRGALSVLMLGAFTFALRTLPLADAYAIFFVAPLIITIMAALWLDERVGAGQWLAIAVGFAGVMIVLKPSGSGWFTLAGVAILGAAFGYAVGAITVRTLGRTDTTQAMVFWMLAMTAGIAGALAWPQWIALQREHWPALLAVGTAGALGQWAITEAFRRAPASTLAPLEYTALLWGLALDWSLVHTMSDIFGNYAQAEAHAGLVKSGSAQVLTKGTVSLALAGDGEGVDLGVDVAKFTISPAKVAKVKVKAKDRDD